MLTRDDLPLGPDRFPRGNSAVCVEDVYISLMDWPKHYEVSGWCSNGGRLEVFHCYSLRSLNQYLKGVFQ